MSCINCVFPPFIAGEGFSRNEEAFKGGKRKTIYSWVCDDTERQKAETRARCFNG